MGVVCVFETFMSFIYVEVFMSAGTERERNESSRDIRMNRGHYFVGPV